MSYILEALKKSQQERGRGQVPDIQTLHQSVATPELVAPRWPYWALVISLLALAFLLGWLRPWSSPAVPVTPAAITEPVPASGAMPESVQDKAVTPQAVEPVPPVMAAQKSVAQVETQSVASAHQDVDPNTLRDISQLPSMLQQAIPQMQFSGHVYSNSPQQRSVIINGHFMSEGDELIPGMKLLQITPDSVIFDYQGQKFSVAVLHDWSFQ
jgi:general secretion pathway protein B